VALFSDNGYIDDLASGRICVALGHGGDFNTAAQRARQADNGMHIVARCRRAACSSASCSSTKCATARRAGR